MEKLNCLNSVPTRLFTAIPLILGLATMVAVPTVKAATMPHVDVVDAFIDVDRDGIPNEAADDMLDVVLWCLGDTPIKVDIRNGFVDVDEDGVVGEATDDLTGCRINNESGGGIPASDDWNIINGKVDLNLDTFTDNADFALDIELLNLP